MQALRKTCEKHGEFEAREINLNGRTLVISACPTCSQEREIREREQRVKLEIAAREERAKREMEETAIPFRFQSRTFETFQAETPEQKRALSIARDYAQNFNPVSGSGLIFAGMPGNGKSHLAASIMLELMRDYSVRYVTCMDIIRAIRETWRKDSESSERQLLKYLGDELDLLVIDEIGVQYGSDGEQNILFDVLDRRYRNMRCTILLSNQDAEGLKKFVGERIFDRLRDTCKWVPFTWGSYRGKK